MPKIYEYFGLIFLIYTRNEHPPIHVHVKKGTKVSVIEIILDKTTKKIKSISPRRVGNSASATVIGTPHAMRLKLSTTNI